jgi:hypothetical protein
VSSRLDAVAGMDRPTLAAALLCTQAVLSRLGRLDLEGGVTIERRGPAYTIARGDLLLAHDRLWEPRETADLSARTLPSDVVAHLERTAWRLEDALAVVGFQYDAPDAVCTVPPLPGERNLTRRIEQ